MTSRKTGEELPALMRSLRPITPQEMRQRLGRGGKVAWIDRKATGVETLRAQRRLVITGRMELGKSREAAELVRRAVAAAERRGLSFHVGNIFSADLFYTPEPAVFDLMERYNILGVEMETAGIYTLAAELGAEALALCTVSDLIRSRTALSPAERQTSFDEMISLALETAFGTAR